MKLADAKKTLVRNIPYIAVGGLATNLGEAWRLAEGADLAEKAQDLLLNNALGNAFADPFPSMHPTDLLVGTALGAAFRLAVYIKGKNAKKYRHNVEYGSARWGNRSDIEPFVDPVFRNNIILSKTERITMNSRPKNPKYARNKNVLVVGGSGSGKTRFYITPQLLQMSGSYVVCDPKGQIVYEVGNLLKNNGYRIKIFNIVDFKKSMKYNPFAYLRDEKDILKLVNILILNTKGDGKSSDPFWEQAERLLYTALIGYLFYEAPEEEQNFATMLEMLNAMEVREDNEDFKNAVDYLFDELAKRDPKHFAVRQYVKFKMAAGVATCN